MRRARTTHLLAATTAAAVVAGLSSRPTPPRSPPPGLSVSAQTVDSRVGSPVRPTQAQADAVEAVLKASPGTRATWDARFGTPRTLTPTIGRTLSGPTVR